MGFENIWKRAFFIRNKWGSESLRFLFQISQVSSTWVTVTCYVTVSLSLVKSVFTWRHSGHVDVPKQRNGGHDGVPGREMNHELGMELLSLLARGDLKRTFDERSKIAEGYREWKRALPHCK